MFSAAMALAVLTLGACSTPPRPSRALLSPAQMSPDSVVLEMFFVRFPFGDPTATDKLWEEIDEQQLAADLRERLSRNGFRVGVVGGQLPVELSKLLELSNKPAPGGKTEEVKVEDLESQPRVVRRHLQLRAGNRSELLASGIYEHLPVLIWSDGQISGQTYAQAQGVFALKAFPQADGRFRVELVPELHHGQPRQRWIGSRGMLRLETCRPRETFDDMTIAVELAPGGMLVLGSLSDRPGSLGHYFFTENHDRLEQKLLLVRLLQTQHDALFNPAEQPDSAAP